VRHAGGEQADGRHLLGNLQLLLELDADVTSSRITTVPSAAASAVTAVAEGTIAQLTMSVWPALLPRQCSGTRDSTAPVGESRRAARMASTHGPVEQIIDRAAGAALRDTP
jgi:hypothetical protein